ncbi:hypothetical protein [Haladaptatus sp. CMAA 1911]|uniref:hypothetical protein n=1 Tax=unclassified Haladaptatus TaxID=2622732 RepID=UPI0037547AF8
MYRTILTEGEISCERYETIETGVNLYTNNDELVAFIPYGNLHAIINEDVYTDDEDETRSIF